MRAAVRLRAVLLAGVLAASVAACTAAPPNHSARSGPVSSGPTSPTANVHSAAPPSCGAVTSSTSGGGPFDAVGAASARAAWSLVGRTIRHTADGGRHWQVQFRGRPGVQLQSVDVLDATHVWVVAEHGLYWTVNGGGRWHAYPEHCPLIHSVDFVDENHGYAIAGGANGGLWQGGTLWHTADAGAHWQRLAAAPDAQSVCFADGNRGWLGARGGIFATYDGGQHWRRQLGPRHLGGALLTTVVCNRFGAWALATGQGAMNQQAHIGYHLVRGRWHPIFAEQYFPHRGVRVRTDSPSAYAGPVTVAGRRGVFVDSCPACSTRTPHGMLSPTTVLAVARGTAVHRIGSAGGLSNPYGVAFPSPNAGWVVGRRVWSPNSTPDRWVARVVIAHTTDGGRHWTTQLTAPSH